MPDNVLFRPLTNKPRRMADLIADEIDKPDATEDRGKVKPFLAGAIQGMGDVASDFTSPFSLATMAAAPLSKAFTGIRGLGRIATLASGAESAGMDAAAINRSLEESHAILKGVGKMKRAEDAVSEGRQAATAAKRSLPKSERYTAEYPKTPSARATEAARLKAERRYRRTGEGHD